ncbi:TldD/PmbA family protein [Clostridia bacterium]|nr:TldD/PmbA family protein [Clostridia bacterium]
MTFNKKQLERLLEITLERGGDFAEIYEEKKSVNLCSMEEKKIEDVSSGTVGGVGVRLIANDQTYYAYTSEFSYEAVENCAKAVAQTQKGKGPVNKIKLDEINVIQKKDTLIDPEDVEMDEKIELIRKADSYCWSRDERIIQVKVVYGDVTQNVVIANSEGVYVQDKRVRTKLIVQIVAQDEDGNIQSGYDAIGASTGFEFMRSNNPEKVAEQALRRVQLLLSASPAPAGKMTVVMSSEAGGTMVHEACGHGLEADLVEKGLSVYGGKIGELVASPLVTVIDDGTMENRYGSATYDDEGAPCQKNILIENGILKKYMTDRLSAKKMGAEPSGNGRRESYKHKPVTRMTNTYIAPGPHDPEEIVKEVEYGFFARKMGGGQVNTATGDFVFEVSEGYMIENGKIGRPVKGATLTGNGPEVLMKIDRVGNDLGYSIGTCGKDGQGVSVADAQPTIRIPELIVGGVVEEEE